MPDLTRIIDALEALCRAYPGLTGIGVDTRTYDGAHITLNTSTDQGVHDLAEMFGLTVHSHKMDGSTWFAAYGGSPRSFSIFGPHRPIVETQANEDAITAALAQADEAVAE